MTTLYEILGVEEDADDIDIKRAYRKKAQENHPDKGGDTEMFQAISKAYDVLSDALKRQHYDETGQTNMRNVEGDVIEGLISIALQVMQNADVRHTNIVQTIEQLVRGQQSRYNDTILRLKNSEDVFREAAKRTSVKNNSENILSNAFNSQADGLKGQADRLQAMLIVGNKILEILKDYEYRVDPRTSPTYYSHTSSSTTGIHF
jgi:curved DNA-binding protein CbpA